MIKCYVLVTALLVAGLIGKVGAESGGDTFVDRLLETTAPSKYEFPGNAPAASWFLPSYNADQWLDATGGIGYERSNGYDPYFSTDVENLMYNRSTSIYIRTTFNVEELLPNQFLTLQLRYDDAFIAYLNGQEIARSSNVPNPPDSGAGATVQNYDTDAVIFEPFDLKAAREHVVIGENVLAIHGFNYGIASSDFLMSARIDRYVASIPDGPCFEELATNPVAGHLGSPAIHSLKAFDGKIYMGFGEWNGHPGPTVLCSYDPATHTFATEHSINTDSIGVMREIDGKLWIPSADPVHYSRFTDLSILHPNGRLEQRSPTGFYHLFDVFERDNGELWMMGSKDENETQTDGAAIYLSTDRGETWSDITWENSIGSRFYWGFELGGNVVVENAAYSDIGWNAYSTPNNRPYKPTRIGSGTDAPVIYKQAQTPGFRSSVSSLLRATPGGEFDEILLQNIFDFATRGAEVFVLRSESISYCADIAAAEPEWETLELFGVPANASAIEIDGENIYLGTAGGELLGVGLDGALLGGPADVVDRMPDQFGQCMVVSGNTLAVGAPGDSGALTQSGRVQIFDRDGADGAWVAGQTILPPAEHFGGFFGDAIALVGDDLVVVESGIFSSNDRGAGSRIHTYQRGEDGSWAFDRSLTLAFAQAVELVDDRLYVGTRAGLSRYSFPELFALGYYGFAPYYECQATLTSGVHSDGRTIIFSGNSGDVSRAGAPGATTAFFTGTATSTRLSEGAQTRNGFSIDHDDQWLAVGEPRADHGLDLLQAGGVEILAESDIPGTLYEMTAYITPPDAEPEDGFGHSVSLSDDGQLLLVGAPLSRGADGERRGAVYVYRRIAGLWEMQRKITPVESPGTWEFGSTVLIDGNTGIIGSGFSDGSQSDLERLEFVNLAQPLTYDVWAAEQNLTAPDDDPSADPDGDGIDNLTTFALGGRIDFQPEMREDTAGERIFYHRQREDPSGSGLKYTVEFSKDLTAWEPGTGSSEGPVDAGWRSVETLVTGDYRFARLRIELLSRN